MRHFSRKISMGLWVYFQILSDTSLPKPNLSRPTPPVIRGVTGKIFLRGQSHFSWFFSQREMLFPGRKFPFWWTKNKFMWFWKVRSKKNQKKKSSPHSVTFPPSILPFAIFRLPFFDFPSFLVHFPFFSLPLFFLLCQQKFPGQKSLGATLPPACYATAGDTKYPFLGILL